MHSEPKLMTAIAQLKEDQRFQQVSDRTKVGVVETIRGSLSDVPSQYSEKQVVNALRYLLLQEDPNNLLFRDERQDQRHEDIRDEYSNPFYSHTHCGNHYDISDILFINMAMNSSSGNSSGGGADCGNCDGDGALVACVVVLVCSACACTVCCCVNSADTIQHRESALIKCVKVGLNTIAFIGGAAGTVCGFLANRSSIQAPSYDDAADPNHTHNTNHLSSNAAFWALTSAVSFAVGATASAIVSYINKKNICLPKPKTPDPDLLAEIEDIANLLKGQWLGSADDNTDQVRAFIKAVVQTVIEGRYKPDADLKRQHDYITHSRNSGSVSSSRARLLADPVYDAEKLPSAPSAPIDWSKSYVPSAPPASSMRYQGDAF